MSVFDEIHRLTYAVVCDCDHPTGEECVTMQIRRAAERGDAAAIRALLPRLTVKGPQWSHDAAQRIRAITPFRQMSATDVIDRLAAGGGPFDHTLTQSKPEETE